MLFLCIMGSFAVVSPAQAPKTPPSSNSPKANDENIDKNDGSKSLPSCYYLPSPPITAEAVAAKFAGTVNIEGTVTVKGKIENIRILKSPGLGLDESIVETLKKWKCKPAIGPDGKPIPVQVSFQIKFNVH